MKIGGVITAAGLSSRMKEFKPLLRLNGFPMIQMTVQSMKNAGVEKIVVVTGYRGQEIVRALKDEDVILAENKEYAVTDMLTSAKVGIRKLGEVDGILLLPGDIPLIAPDTYGRILDRAAFLLSDKNRVHGMIPVWEQKRVHPLFLFQEAGEQVLAYQGECGLRGALKLMETEEIPVSDPGADRDADFPEDFLWMQAYARKTKGVSREICEAWYEEVELPEHIRAHCRAVGMLAGEIAEKLVQRGACLDVELCRSGGFLHDLLRLQKHHEQAAGDFLRTRGYEALAFIVEHHRGFEDKPSSVCREDVVVCLADKLIQETERVSFKVRYEKALGQRIIKEEKLRDFRICCELAKEFEVITGERLQELHISE